MIDETLSLPERKKICGAPYSAGIIFLVFCVGVLGGALGGAATFQMLTKSNTASQGAPLPTKDGVVPPSISGEENATIAAVKKTSSSVVSIIISKDMSQVYQKTGQNVFPFDNLFDNLGFPFEFRTAPQPNSGNQQKQDTQNQEPQRPQKQKVGGGSGFIISADGMILTNKHVVADDAADYTVVTTDGKEYPAKVLAKDPVNDLAILKIDAKGLVPLVLGDSDGIEIGQTVIAIGNTLGEYKNTVTRGVISGIDRVVQASNGAGSSEVIQEAIQTDAAINPGNSGGPLLNLRGEVVGINTAVNRSGQSIGFAIPIGVAKRSVESIKKFGKIIRPWLGVRYSLIDEEYIKKNNLPIDHGAIILGDQVQKLLGVIPGSPAERAGLRDGDIILELNGKKIDQGHALANAIAQYNPGDEVTVKVFSGGKTRDVKVKLEEFKEQK